MWLVDGDGFAPLRCTATCRRLISSNGAAERCTVPKPSSPWCARSNPGQPVHVPDMLHDKAYLERAPLAVSVVEIAGIRTLLTVPMLKEDELIGAFTIYRQGGSAVHRQADRAGHELRCPGGHRHRKRAPASTNCVSAPRSGQSLEQQTATSRCSR